MKLSAVVISRNDNYGGNLYDRAKYCINSLINTFDEAWYIDWNSPGETGLLDDIIDDIQKTGKLRYIRVDQEAVQQMTKFDPAAQVCCEVLARNLGIRRATGDIIVSTNIDVISPTREALDKFLSESYQEDTFYTISRRALDLQEAKRFPYLDIKTLHAELDDKHPERQMLEKVVEGDNYSIINCCGDFQLAHRKIWNEIRGFEESMRYCLYTDTNVQKKAVKHGFKLKAAYNPALFHISHEGGGGSFVNGQNKVANDFIKYIATSDKTENLDTWGFSYADIEYAVI